jgi:hypothetical protein
MFIVPCAFQLIPDYLTGSGIVPTASRPRSAHDTSYGPFKASVSNLELESFLGYGNRGERPQAPEFRITAFGGFSKFDLVDQWVHYLCQQ